MFDPDCRLGELVNCGYVVELLRGCEAGTISKGTRQQLTTLLEEGQCPGLEGTTLTAPVPTPSPGCSRNPGAGAGLEGTTFTAPVPTPSPGCSRNPGAGAGLEGPTLSAPVPTPSPDCSKNADAAEEPLAAHRPQNGSLSNNASSVECTASGTHSSVECTASVTYSPGGCGDSSVVDSCQKCSPGSQQAQKRGCDQSADSESGPPAKKCRQDNGSQLAMLNRSMPPFYFDFRKKIFTGCPK